MNEFIEKGIKNSYNYQEYKALVSDLLKEGKSTGHLQSEELTNYSALNDQRMRRLDKTLRLDDRTKKTISDIDVTQTWIVLSEGWCGDAAQVLPVLNILQELNTGIDLRIVLRDDHEGLMNNFLTNGGKSIPKLIIYDRQQKKVINSWGPRPSVATKMVNDHKEKYGSLDAQFRQELQVWYNKDKGNTIIKDVMELMQFITVHN